MYFLAHVTAGIPGDAKGYVALMMDQLVRNRHSLSIARASSSPREMECLSATPNSYATCRTVGADRGPYVLYIQWDCLAH